MTEDERVAYLEHVRYYKVVKETLKYATHEPLASVIYLHRNQNGHCHGCEVTGEDWNYAPYPCKTIKIIYEGVRPK